MYLNYRQSFLPLKFISRTGMLLPSSNSLTITLAVENKTKKTLYVLKIPPHGGASPLTNRRLSANLHALLRSKALIFQPCWSCIGLASVLQRHPFSGPIHSAGELLHTPWRMPTSMATVLLSKWIDTFHGISYEHTLRHLNMTFGSSRIASSAYQKWPT